MNRRLPCTYQPGSIVYHRMESGGPAGMIVNVCFNINWSVLYTVQWGFDKTADHYEAELSTAQTFSPGEDDGGVSVK